MEVTGLYIVTVTCRLFYHLCDYLLTLSIFSHVYMYGSRTFVTKKLCPIHIKVGTQTHHNEKHHHLDVTSINLSQIKATQTKKQLGVSHGIGKQ